MMWNERDHLLCVVYDAYTLSGSISYLPQRGAGTRTPQTTTEICKDRKPVLLVCLQQKKKKKKKEGREVCRPLDTFLLRWSDCYSYTGQFFFTMA